MAKCDTSVTWRFSRASQQDLSTASVMTSDTHTESSGSSEKLTMRHAERPSVQGRVMVYPKAFRHPVACPPAAPPPRTLAFAEVAAVKVEPTPGKELAQSRKNRFQGYLTRGKAAFALKPARSPCSDEFLGTLRGQGQPGFTDLPMTPATPGTTLHIRGVTRSSIYRSNFEMYDPGSDWPEHRHIR